MNRTIATLACASLFAALPGFAQSPDANSGAKPVATDSRAPANPAQDKKKPKKVWTNEEITKVSGGVSVVGDPSTSGSDTKKKDEPTQENNDFRQRQVNEYKKQLSQLQSQIDAIDKRISQLKNFKGDNTSPSGGININQGYNMVPLEDQLKQLDAKKKELQGKIDELESDARKNGISSDDLR